MTDVDDRDLRSAFEELKAPPSTANYAERARRESAPARPLAHRWRVGLTSLAAVSAAAVVFAGGYAVLHFHLGGGAASSLSTTAGGTGTSGTTDLRPNAAAGQQGSTPSTVSRAQAMAEARGGSGIASNITDVQARLATWADWERISSGTALPTGSAQRITLVPSAAAVAASGESPTALLWIVAVHGRFAPSVSPAAWDWVVEAIDATTGQTLGVYADRGSWPPAGFSSLRDLGGP